MPTRKRSRKAAAAVIGTIVVTIIDITLWMALSSFSSGLFQGLSGQEIFDVKVVKVKKIAAETWEVGILISNAGHRELTISMLKVGEVSSTGERVLWSTSQIGNVLKSGQSNLATIRGSFGTAGEPVDIEVITESGSLIFSSARLP